MKLFILTEKPGLYFNQRLYEESKRQDIELQFINPFHISIPFSKEVEKQFMNSVLLSRITGFRFDDFDYSLITYLENLGSTSLNSLTKINLLRSKDLQEQFFRKNNIPCVEGLTIRGNPNQKSIQSWFDKFPRNQRFILKSIRSSGGRGIIRLENTLEAKEYLYQQFQANDQRYIIQPYLPHEAEYRILFIKNEIVGVIKKTPHPSDFRANFACNAKGEYILLDSLDQDLIHMIKKTIKDLDIFYGGIDIINGLILEVNLSPGIQYFEQFSNIDIVKIIAEEIKKLSQHKHLDQ